MNCNDFHRQLTAVIEEHRPTTDMSSALAQHREHCDDSACLQAWADFELLAAIIPVWQASVPETSLVQGVVSRLCDCVDDRPEEPILVAAVKGERKPVSQIVPNLNGSSSSRVELTSRVSDDDTRESRRSLLALLVAVACLLLFVPLLRLGGIPKIDVAEQALPEAPTSVAVEEMLVATEPVHVSKVVRGYAGVPQSATEFVTDAMVLFIPADLSGPEDEEPSRAGQWRGRLGEQLEPIGRELGTAVDAFLEAVSEPPMRST